MRDAQRLGGAYHCSGVRLSDLHAAYYASQQYSVGQIVRIGDLEGEIIQLTPTAVLLSTQEGRVLVPAKRFSEESSTLLVGGV